MSAPTVAIIGASTNRSKFGNKSVRAHADCGWTVYPIHPSADEIEGLPAYPDLASVPGAVTRISLYVPPAVGATLAEQIANTSAEEVYVNPGAEGPVLEAALRDHQVANVRYACSIVELGVSPAAYPG